MDYYVDVTPAPSPSVFYASEAALGHIPSTKNSYGATRFITTDYADLHSGLRDIKGTEKLPKKSHEIDSTPLLPRNADIASLRVSSQEVHTQVKDSEVSKIAEARIRLLAIKYANDSVSAEMIARLEILNSRLIERSPRVTVEQISFLEQSIGSIKSIEQSRLDRAKRLGLPI